MSTNAVSTLTAKAMGLRTIAIAVAIGLFLSIAVTSAQAGHTMGTLDCGQAGTFEVDGQGPLPSGFEAPGPWSGLFLLEGTTQVFKAFSIEGVSFRSELPAKANYPKPLLNCTLTSEGMGFPAGFWTLQGVLRP